MSKSTILGPNGKPFRSASELATHRPGRQVSARYDAAQTSDESRRHWSEADGLSARSANSPAVRRTVRNRARYEVANNSYARGIVETLANDTIGTGPRLQLQTEDADLNRRVETAFTAWADEIGLPEKLRTMRKARAQDGESFGMFVSNPRVKGPIRLDLRIVEADQITSPDLLPLDVYKIDGIEFDTYGNPTAYHLLRYHPGDSVTYGWEYDTIPARLVVHWFRVDRPGQLRGVPDIMPALPLFAYLRRYTLATVSAAEIAASFAAMLQSNMPPGDDAEDANPFETLEITRGMMTTLPAGWVMNQLRAEHPTTTYPMFKAEILNEIARCLNMPYNVAAGNSSSYNYSSGRLDHQTYYKSLRVDQSEAECVVLDPILDEWLDEAMMGTDIVPRGMVDFPRQWFWDGAEHIDPAKEADAQSTRLANRTTSLAREYARQGLDWESQVEQIARERAKFESLGMAYPGDPPAVAPPPMDQPQSDNSLGDGNASTEDS